MYWKNNTRWKIVSLPAPNWAGGNDSQPPVGSGLTFHKLIVVCLQRSRLLGHDGFKRAPAEPSAFASAASVLHHCLSQSLSGFAEDKSAFHPRRFSHKRLSVWAKVSPEEVGLTVSPSADQTCSVFLWNAMWLKWPGLHYFQFDCQTDWNLGTKTTEKELRYRKISMDK